MEWQQQLLEKWMELVLQVANTPPDKQLARVVHYQVQSALLDVIGGGIGLWPGAPGPSSDIPLPSLSVRILRDRTVIVAKGPGPPETSTHNFRTHWNVSSRAELEAAADQLLAVVMLVAHDPIARRLRRCDWQDCQRFYFAVRDHQRDHAFCSEEHRRLFDVANRDHKKSAAYMREWRSLQTQRKKAVRKGSAKR